MATRAQACLLGLALAAALLTAGPAQAVQYVVDGFPLGARIAPGDKTYRSYTCRPSDAYDGTTACTRQLHKKGQAGDLVVSSALLHARDRTTLFAMVHAAPVTLSRDAVQKEIGELSHAIGAAAATVTWSPDDSGDLTWVIASWGRVHLKEITFEDPADLEDYPQRGALVDVVGDLKRSTEQFLPIYRMTGGPGYVYAASFNANGTGSRHYVAAEPTELSVRHYTSSLRALVSKDQSLAKDDYSLWPDVARATRKLALDTSPDTANRELDAVFDGAQSGKLRSHAWALLPLGAIQRLGMGRYWRHDVYGPHTKYPDVRRGAAKLIADHPDDPFIELAYFLLGDFSDALKASPHSPISNVLHYARGYQIVQSLVREALVFAKTRITPDAPPDVADDLQSLLDADPADPDPGLPIGSGLVDGSIVFVNQNPGLFDNKPLSAILADFSGRAAEARAQFEAVSGTSSLADDADYMTGWLERQGGNNQAALSSFARALKAESKFSPREDWDKSAWFDYRWGVLKEAVRIVERLPLGQQVTTVESNPFFDAENALWYTAARSAYRHFDYARAIDVAQMVLKRRNFPVEQLPTTTDPDRIAQVIERIDPKLVDDLNFVELPYLIEASREMADYEGVLQHMDGQEPDAVSSRARAIILKYSMLLDRPVDESGNPTSATPLEHKDLRQALHLIDTTLQHTQGNAAYAALRQWLYYREVRILAVYEPKLVAKSVAEMKQEYPASDLLDDALAEEIFADGVELTDVDVARKTFAELLKRFPRGNAVDNAYSWMVIGLRCANRMAEARKINSEIVRRFPLTRHAQYALERAPDLERPDDSWRGQNGCGFYERR